MLKFFSRKNKRQRGQSLVELGLAMVVLLFLLAGAINFGIAFFSYVAISDAAQEGALYGSIVPATDTLGTINTSGIIMRVQQSSSSPVKLSTIIPTVNFDGTAKQTCTGRLLTVTIVYHCPITMPIVGIFTTDIKLTASATSTIMTSTTTNCP
jgi:Flp pilus assembly protein TadG